MTIDEVIQKISQDFINGNLSTVRDEFERMGGLMAAHVAVEVMEKLEGFERLHWAVLCQRMYELGGKK